MKKYFDSHNNGINVRVLLRNVIGWPGLLVAADFTCNRDASADWLPADAVGGCVCVAIGPFVASSAPVCCVTVAVLGAGPLI